MEPPNGRDAAEFNHHEVQHSILAIDERQTNGIADLFPSALESGQRGEEQALAGSQKCTTMLINCSQSNGDATMVLGPIVGEENGVMDSAEMAFGSVVLPTLPAERNHEAERAPDGYPETLMSLPREREGELISTVSASLSTFFRTTNMDVGASTEIPASWEELRSAHAHLGYETGPSSSDDASPGSRNSTEERAFVDSFCREPLKGEGLDMGNGQGLSETLQSSGIPDTKNEGPSSPTTEDGERPLAPRPGKEKGPLGELSLRKVLCDPVTGSFLDDAMVALCGHSFGSGGLQRVLDTHSCISCGAGVPPKTLVPNLALRAAVLAYRHEDHVWQRKTLKGTKRRREHFEMHEAAEPKGTSADPTGSVDFTYVDFRPKGVQFPFVVGDKVIIKGNKRTPERLFGMAAVITNQCLNGWYLVRTLDTGESVRLQYRSLQKLGETDAPFSSKPRLSTEHQVDSGCGPLITDRPIGDQTSVSPVSEDDLKSHSPSSRPENEVVRSVNPERPSDGALTRSIIGGGREGCTTSDRSNGSQEVGRTTNNLHFVDGLSKSVDKVEEVSEAMETLESADLEAVDAGFDNRSADLLKDTDSLHVSSNDDKFLHAGLNHDVGAKVWVGTGMTDPEATILKDGQGLPNTGSSGSDGRGSTVDGDKFPQVVSSLGDGDEIIRTRSRRAVHSKSSAGSGGFLKESDPYRKIYTSGNRRRKTKDEPVIKMTPDHVTAESKPALQGTDSNEKVFEKLPAKGSSVPGSGTGKPGRDLKLRSANEILQIMRKDMLKLEEQIPLNFLLRSWRVRRTKWQKQVQASQTVLELGELVRDFRYSLLLTAAGGMSDEEWDMRIVQIIESEDIRLLVPLWGRLCSDVYKWLESRPKDLPGKDIQLGKPLTVEDMKHNSEGIAASISSVHMTTAATLAALDTVTEQDIDSSIKALLASTMKLLQQQSRSELSAVREALEWEKRHLTARLGHLEHKLTNLQGTSELNGAEDNAIHPMLSSGNPEVGQFTSPSTDQIGECPMDPTPLESEQGYETEECESDTPLPAQDPDGEATDMSDSD